MLYDFFSTTLLLLAFARDFRYQAICVYLQNKAGACTGTRLLICMLAIKLCGEQN